MSPFPCCFFSFSPHIKNSTNMTPKRKWKIRDILCWASELSRMGLIDQIAEEIHTVLNFSHGNSV